MKETLFILLTFVSISAHSTEVRDISARELIKGYYDNPAKANILYKNKPLIVKGTILRIASSDNLYTAPDYSVCIFYEKYGYILPSGVIVYITESDAIKIERGMFVKLFCDNGVTGTFLDGGISLGDRKKPCKLVEKDIK